MQAVHAYSFYLMQIEDRLFVNYQALNDVTVPLRDVVNYEAHVSNGSEFTYRKVVYVQRQLNISLEELHNMVNKYYTQLIYPCKQILLYFS